MKKRPGPTAAGGHDLQGVLLIPVSGRVVGVVCGGGEQNDEEVSGTPRSVSRNML